MLLNSDLWVSALIRRAEIGGAFATVVKKGDDRAGSVIVKAYDASTRTARLFTEAFGLDGERQWIQPVSSEMEGELEAVVRKLVEKRVHEVVAGDEEVHRFRRQRDLDIAFAGAALVSFQRTLAPLSARAWPRSTTCWARPSRTTKAVSVPSEARLVARCGTSTPSTWPTWISTRTNCPGRIIRSGLAKRMRNGTVPVVSDTAMPGLTW